MPTRFQPTRFSNLESLSPNFERRNSQNNQRDRSSSDGALGLRKKFRPERKGINENWRHPANEKREAGNSRSENNLEARHDVNKPSSGENGHHGNLKRNNHAGNNNRGSAKRNNKHEERKNNTEPDKGEDFIS